MYRKSDLPVFMIISAMAFILLLGAFALIVVHHFFSPNLFYRDIAVVLLIFSFTFQVQLYMLKMEIMEKKLIKVLQTPPEVYAAISSGGNLAMMLYNTLFWFALVIVATAFLPALFNKVTGA